jgi:hypothetical protein
LIAEMRQPLALLAQIVFRFALQQVRGGIALAPHIIGLSPTPSTADGLSHNVVPRSTGDESNFGREQSKKTPGQKQVKAGTNDRFWA